MLGAVYFVFRSDLNSPTRPASETATASHVQD
jgi:hypothetical protein